MVTAPEQRKNGPRRLEFRNFHKELPTTGCSSRKGVVCKSERILAIGICWKLPLHLRVDQPRGSGTVQMTGGNEDGRALAVGCSETVAAAATFFPR